VLGPWEFFWRAGSCIYSCAYLSAVWSGGPVQFYLGTLVVWAAGLYGFFFLFGPAVAGYGTVELVMGGGLFFIFFLQFCCQFSWRLDVCGRNFVLYIFCW